MANSSDRDIVAEVKAAIDIVDIINAYLDLKPAGGQRFKALCPFHREKTPSFHVSRDRQSFHCFGCDKGGDVFTFIQDMEGLTFPETLEQLADRAGIKIERNRPRNNDEESQRKELLKLANSAAHYYKKTLADHEKGAIGRDYLAKRNLRPETIEQFGLGYVPEGWQHLTDYVRQQGLSNKLLEMSGLAIQGKQGLYDRFRNRLIFPIRDVSGRVVAFGGRTLGDDSAKYINSPESSIYKKSKIFYGLFEARDALRQSKEAILVEGYFDCLRCVDAGIENAVATCGTALTPEQATLLRRYVSSVLVVFDGDTAGIRAALRSVGILTAAGLTVRAMTLPDGQDPDDYIRENGAQEFRDMAQQAPDFIRFYVHTNADRTDTIEGRSAVAKELFAVLSDINDLMRQDEYIKLLAQQLGLDLFRCKEAFSKFIREQRRGPAQDRQEPPSTIKINDHDREFVAILLEDTELLKEACATVATLDVSQGVVIQVLHVLADGPEPTALNRLQTEEARKLYSAAANSDCTWGDRAHDLVHERLNRFKKDALLRQRDRIKEEIYRAERSNDGALMDELTLKKIGVDRQIDQVGAA